MAFFLLAGVALGAGLAGVVILAYRAFGRRAPKWVAPVLLGGGILGVQVWSEYTWFERQLAEQPDRFLLIATEERSTLLPPWTLVFPRVDGFTLADVPSAVRNPETGAHVAVRVWRLDRHNEPAFTLRLYDCAGRAFGPIADGEPDARGVPPVVAWSPVAENDAFFARFCAGS